MAENVKKEVKPGMPDEKAAKDAVKATLLAMTKTDAQKAAAVKATGSVAVKAPSGAAVRVEEKPVKVAPKVDAAKAPTAEPQKPEVAKAETVKASAPKTDELKAEAAKAEPGKAAATEEAPKAESKKEADPSKEFVDGIMTEMSLKGGSKKRLIKMLGEQFNFDKQKVMFRLKRALISERYAQVHAEAGH
ncbi:MAG: hypothetical protein O8C61_03025 [Candidatus Methanoperedens sp.]|nr:hypothetical protein [Candidatus Methanoperedens sp.]